VATSAHTVNAMYLATISCAVRKLKIAPPVRAIPLRPQRDCVDRIASNVRYLVPKRNWCYAVFEWRTQGSRFCGRAVRFPSADAAAAGEVIFRYLGCIRSFAITREFAGIFTSSFRHGSRYSRAERALRKLAAHLPLSTTARCMYAPSPNFDPIKILIPAR